MRRTAEWVPGAGWENGTVFDSEELCVQVRDEYERFIREVCEVIERHPMPMLSLKTALGVCLNRLVPGGHTVERLPSEEAEESRSRW